MKSKSSKPKVFVFGIDGFVPELALDKYKKYLPTFSRLMHEGAYGKLASTVPPSSIVAWTTMASGRDPSETGIHSYTPKPGPHVSRRLTNSADVRVPLLWDILGKHQKTSVALNIPLTYPTKKVRGYMVSDFLTPAFDEKSVYPASFKPTVKKLSGGKDYPFDVADEFVKYKKLDLDHLIRETYRMTDIHLKVARHTWDALDWDLFFFVAIGSDRLHHMFWKHIDPAHPNHVKNSKYKNVILDFYRYLDAELAKFLASKKIDENTTIVIASDHGMARMVHRFNVNDWLRANGYLVLKPEAELLYGEKPQRLNHEHIDWRRTRAIASGGYQGRIYCFGKNKPKLVAELARKLKVIRGVRGEKLDNKIFKGTDYRKRDLEAADLIVYFDNLMYGVNNDIGNKGFYSLETSVGIDDAGHAPYGTLIIKDSHLTRRGKLSRADIMQVAPTILKALHLPEYTSLPGKPFIK